MKAANKYFRLCILLLALILPLNGCSKTQKAEETGVLNVYASFFPFYALTDALIENVPDVQLNCLVQPQDGCLRNYQLSDWDFSLVSRAADMMIMGGRGLESFESLLYSLGENGPAVAAVLYNMELKKFPAANDHSQTHWSDENPHIYMTIDGAREISERIASALALINADNESIYSENLANIKNRLGSVDNSIQETRASAAGTDVIVMNEALAYIAGEYDLNISLCYARESGEEMDSAALEQCLKTLKSTNAQIIMIEKQAPQNLLNALEDAGYTLARMDTLSTRSAGEGFEGFIAAMQENAYVLQEAVLKANQAV